MKKSGLKIAIVGATGAVGREMIEVLTTRKFPFTDLKCFASSVSVGTELECGGKTWSCEVLKLGCFAGVDFAFFDASDEISREWVNEARSAGACVIDNSGTYRMDPKVALVVPEVNGYHLESLKSNARSGSLIAGPNCTTIQLVMTLKPLHDVYGLERVIVSTYQAVSGAGSAAVEELKTQTADLLAGKKANPVHLKHPIAFNCIPQIGSFLTGEDDGITSEEKKVILETRKILDLPALRVACTAVRVPTAAAHAESVLCEFQRAPELEEVRKILSAFPGVEVRDVPKDGIYPMNIHSAGKDSVSVGRIRKDPTSPNGLQFWVVSDNLRKGAALNAIQIAEAILR